MRDEKGGHSGLFLRGFDFSPGAKANVYLYSSLARALATSHPSSVYYIGCVLL